MCPHSTAWTQVMLTMNRNFLFISLSRNQMCVPILSAWTQFIVNKIFWVVSLHEETFFLSQFQLFGDMLTINTNFLVALMPYFVLDCFNFVSILLITFIYSAKVSCAGLQQTNIITPICSTDNDQNISKYFTKRSFGNFYSSTTNLKKEKNIAHIDNQV